ncbi:MAG: flippase-like domain-containing protein [Gammaproteobacteria bacterium]|nr:flippase-like domain-containing protein [Candidatus Competibacteraceae bacterium]MCP5198211.1 flippase-like domain-containing protein [Gammaproteobacteria bacterium]
MKGNIFNWLRRIFYLIILLGLIIFLIRQGVEPWRILAANPQAFIGVMVVTTLGILVQANAFKMCLPQDSKYPPLSRLVEIWAISGTTSLLVPVVASLAMRTVLLQREGIGLKANVLATVRQTWFNCECALFTGAIVLIAYPWPVIPYLGYGLGSIWFGLWLSRKCLLAYSGSYIKLHFPSALRIAYSPSWLAWFWLSGQVITMAVNYWMVFMLMAAPLEWHESFLLATLTILAGLFVFVPNGLGILDALWVWVGNRQGLVLGESVALALIMRFGYLAAAVLLWFGLSQWRRVFHRSIDG